MKLTALMLLMLLFLCTSAAVSGYNNTGDIGRAIAVAVPQNELTQEELDRGDELSVATNTLFSYTIPTSEYVRFSVYDTKGIELAVLIDELKPAGEFSAELKSAKLPKGLYYTRLVVGSYTEVRKLNITK